MGYLSHPIGQQASGRNKLKRGHWSQTHTEGQFNVDLMCVFGLWEHLEKAHVRMRRTAKHHIDCGAKRYLLKAIFDCVGESDLIYSTYSFTAIQMLLF